MNWDRDKIYEKVKSSVERFGSSNSQQIKQFTFWLSECDAAEVLEALLKFFHSEEGYWDQHQMAGTLLFFVQPKPEVDLKKILKPCLKNYNLSVEELPWYLEDAYGKENILEIFSDLKKENLDERELRSVETMQWWINGRHK